MKLYEDYIAKAPEKDYTVGFARRRLQELKAEKFASGTDETASKE